MHAFTGLFTTDLVANDCRVYDWFGAMNKKMMIMIMMMMMIRTMYGSLRY